MLIENTAPDLLDQQVDSMQIHSLQKMVKMNLYHTYHFYKLCTLLYFPPLHQQAFQIYRSNLEIFFLSV